MSDTRSEPLVVDARRPPRRALPLLGAVVPVVGALVLWVVTGSALALLFGLLGPLAAIAGVLDGIRSRRRERRAERLERERADQRALAEIDNRHAGEREAMERAHPDVAGFLDRREEIWRPGRGWSVTLGRADGVSGIRVAGDVNGAVRARAGVLTGAPQPADLTAGVCIRAPRAAGLAVARALVLQACMTALPDRLEVVGTPDGEGEWLAALPHRSGAGRDRFRLAFVGPGEHVPDGVDGVVAVVSPQEPPPPRCAAHLEVATATHATLDADGTSRALAVRAVSRSQALALAGDLTARARRLLPPPPRERSVALADLEQPGGGLTAALGFSENGQVSVDLITDGPHAIVVGTTGTGKSELLITWVTALATGRSPAEVSFLLADFKGGTAFDALRALPHVVGVITDLDGSGATRAIESLRAEMRRREAALTAAGVREVADAPGLGRLVVVVDEFAALLADHPELQRVFVDVAARGRALGVHLIVGTQRAQGVIRDALLTNCALRICLRVGDHGESRMLVGTDDAAELPGGVAGRGHAVLRRAGDVRPVPWRVALTSSTEIGAAARHEGSATPHPVWLPPLPALVDEGMLGARRSGRLRIGLVDEPDHQRRSVLTLEPGVDRGLLVLGGAGAGKSTALDRVARDASSVLRVGPDGEQAWDAVHALAAEVPAGALVLIDDLDVLVSGYPVEYAGPFVAAIEQVVRGCRDARAVVALSASRVSGVWARMVDLVGMRIVLPMPGRVDHLAAGGDPALFDASAPPGRGVLGSRAVQIAWTEPVSRPVAAEPPTWCPTGPTALVTRTPHRTLDSLAQAWPDTEVLLVGDLPAGARAPGTGGPSVHVGDPDQWQRQWTLLTDLRSGHTLVVTAECAPQLRALSGGTELPPYAAPGRGRAWASVRGAPLQRIVLPR